MIWLTDAKYLHNYKIFVKFNNGTETILDLENYIKTKPNNTIFNEIKDIHNFQKVRFSSDLDTIVWDNGADIAPERLYELTLNS
jgi:hypothetical protein